VESDAADWSNIMIPQIGFSVNRASKKVRDESPSASEWIGLARANGPDLKLCSQASRRAFPLGASV
jgi:hypothetical protein